MTAVNSGSEPDADAAKDHDNDGSLGKPIHNLAPLKSLLGPLGVPLTVMTVMRFTGFPR